MTLERLFIKLMNVSPDSSVEEYRVTLSNDDLEELEREMLENTKFIEDEVSELNMREALLELRADREQFIVFSFPTGISAKVYYGDETKIEMLNGN